MFSGSINLESIIQMLWTLEALKGVMYGRNYGVFKFLRRLEILDGERSMDWFHVFLSWPIDIYLLVVNAQFSR
jgi:hypothetical protein